ncbi:hypothetical protein Bca52824_039856 [Brassica carinata]|uniref:DUF1995 domain-containing protein n=1 Tax=Brassica carinata TaxID=52824 RepID=A0A8X7RS96_BRACI|nr:hypothetical protein Bca52824_039856 [Brassica carinata]
MKNTFKALNPLSPSSNHPNLTPFTTAQQRIHPRTRFLVLLCSSLSSSSSPPISKEEAILQAETCLSSGLAKPLNNPKLASPKLKKLKQPRFRLEIPILDNDSPSSLSQLAFPSLATCPPRDEAPTSSSFSSSGQTLLSWNLQSKLSALRSADVAVFMAPERSQLKDVRISTEGFAMKPVVMINPRWLFEEDKSDFIGSFDVI